MAAKKKAMVKVKSYKRKPAVRGHTRRKGIRGKRRLPKKV